MISVSYSFQNWIVYDLTNIECFLWRLFAPHFSSINIDIQEFASCDIVIVMINGGGIVNNSNLCMFGPCFYDSSILHTRRLLQSNDSDGSTLMNISARDSDIYNKLTDLYIAQLIQDFEVAYLEQLDIDLKTES